MAVFTFTSVVIGLLAIQLCTATKVGITNSTAVNVCSRPSYLQCDAAWKNDQLPCGDTICAVGCAMTSTTMCVGGKWNPGTMNEYLKTHGGYEGCDLVWSAVGPLGAHFVGQSSYTESYLAGIAQNCNYCAVINVREGTHWVLITGYKGAGSFYVHDPAGFQAEYTYAEIYQHRASIFSK